MSVKDRTYIFVTVVFLLVSGYFALSNVMVRYAHYKQNLKYDTYFLENYHRQLSSRLSKTLKSSLARMSADNEITSAVEKRNKEQLAKSAEKHLNAIGYEYPSDFFILNFVDRDGVLIYSSNMEYAGCSVPAAAASAALTSKMNQTVFAVCKDRVLQFSVSPLFVDGVLIGAAETGISMDFYANSVEQTIGYSMAMLVKKSEFAESTGRFDSYGDYILMHNSNQSTFKRILSESSDYDSMESRIDSGGLSYRVIDNISFYNSSGNKAGRFVYAKDITDEVSWMRSFVLKTVIMTVFFCAVALLVLRTGFSKTIGELEDRYTSSISRLEASEARYRSYVNSSPIAIFTADSRKYVTDMNEYACSLLGYSISSVTGKSLYQIFNTLPASVMDNFIKRVYFAGTSETSLTFTGASGEHIYMLVKAVKLDDGSLLFNCLDITSTITADKKLQEMNIELEQMNRNLERRIADEVEKNRKQTHVMAEQKKLADMGMMVSAIAHQWRQPLNALGLLVQTLPDSLNLDENNKDVQRIESTAMTLVKQMSETIDNFRLFFETGKEKTEFNAVQELRLSSDILSAKISSCGIKVKFACRLEHEPSYHDEPTCGRCSDCIILGNAGEFRQIVINILYNSMDAINEKMQDIENYEGMINIAVVCGGSRITITFEDNGTGAHTSVLERIFEPYYSTKNDSKSSGIGLYTVKILTEQNMKGKVTAFNNDLGGLSIAVELPVVKRESLSPEG